VAEPLTPADRPRLWKALSAELIKQAAKEAPQTVSVDLDTSKGDVGDIAKAISACDTPHKAKVAPSAALIVSAPGLTADNKSKIKGTNVRSICCRSVGKTW
jgi:hypothetical protein